MKNDSPERKHHFPTRIRRTLSLGLGCLMIVVTGPADASSRKQGALNVHVSGFKHDRGHLVVKLFRRGDKVPKGKAYRRLTSTIESKTAKVRFSQLQHGQYALFLFHDENDNGIPDHSFLGIPTEAMGFSAGFELSLFSGIPDFDDLKFAFSSQHSKKQIRIR